MPFFYILLVITSFLHFAELRVSIKKSPFDSKSYTYRKLNNGVKAFLVADQYASSCETVLRINTPNLLDSDPPGISELLHRTILNTGIQTIEGRSETMETILNKNGGAFFAKTDISGATFSFIADWQLHSKLSNFLSQLLSNEYSESAIQAGLEILERSHLIRAAVPKKRFMYILRDLSLPNSKYRQIANGAYGHLAKKNLHKILLDFLNRNYIGPNTILAMRCHNMESLENISNRFAEIVAGKTTELPNKQSAAFFSAEYLGKLVRFNPLDNHTRSLVFVFVLPESIGSLPYKPLEIIKHVLSRTEKGYLAYYLHKSGYSFKFKAYYEHYPGEQSIFFIKIGLTSKGVEEYNHIGSIVLATIKRLPLFLSKDKFTEFRSAAKFKFNLLLEPSSDQLLYHMIENASKGATRDVLTASLSYSKYDPAGFRNIITSFSVESLILFFSQLDSTNLNKKEPYYQTEYTVMRLPLFPDVDVMKIIKTVPNSRLSVFSLNNHIATDKYIQEGINVKNIPNIPFTYPNLSKNDIITYPAINPYYAICSIIFNVDESILTNPKSYVILRLFIMLLNEQTLPIKQNINFVGGDVAFYPTNKGFRLTLETSTNNFDILMNEIQYRINNVLKTAISDSFFDKSSNKLLYELSKDFKNMQIANMSMLPIWEFSSMLDPRALKTELEKLRPRDISSFGDQLFKRCYLIAVCTESVPLRTIRYYLSAIRGQLGISGHHISQRAVSFQKYWTNPISFLLENGDPNFPHDIYQLSECIIKDRYNGNLVLIYMQITSAVLLRYKTQGFIKTRTFTDNNYYHLSMQVSIPSKTFAQLREKGKQYKEAINKYIQEITPEAFLKIKEQVVKMQNDVIKTNKKIHDIFLENIYGRITVLDLDMFDLTRFQSIDLETFKKFVAAFELNKKVLLEAYIANPISYKYTLEWLKKRQEKEPKMVITYTKEQFFKVEQRIKVQTQ